MSRERIIQIATQEIGITELPAAGHCKRGARLFEGK